jgi:hypothetical protein
MLLRLNVAVIAFLTLLSSQFSYAGDPEETQAKGGNGTRGGGNTIACVLHSKSDGKDYAYEAQGTTERSELDQDIIDACGPLPCSWAKCKLYDAMIRIYDFDNGVINEVGPH